MSRHPLILSVLFCLIYFASFAQGIHITSGAQLIMNGTVKLVVNNGGFNNNGVFSSSSGAIVITGNTATANSIIGGTTPTTFNDLTINKSANDVQLLANITATGNITMLSGNLLLNNFNLNLGATGNITAESETSSITGLTGGLISKTVTLNAPTSINPGNLGAEITSAANLGVTTIYRGNTPQMTATGHPSISRYFDIQPANNTALDATVKFYYLDAELGALSESGLFTWVSADGGVNWSYRGKDASDAISNFVTKNNLTSLNRITLNVDPFTLPVRSLRLTARLVNGDALLSWTTIDEYNNDHFEIERSAGGISFSPIGSKSSSGNVTGAQTYTHTDIHPFSGNTYYRVKQVDVDGHYSYSNIVMVNSSGSLPSYLQAFPVPTANRLNIQYYSPVKKEAVLRLYNTAGKLILVKKLSCQRGINAESLDLSELPAATYLLSLENITKETIQLIKQ